MGYSVAYKMVPAALRDTRCVDHRTLSGGLVGAGESCAAKVGTTMQRQSCMNG